MTDHNPYAMSPASIEEARPKEAAPPLWNPGAAASWCLLLSPVFGAYLHMRNWEALGKPDKAATSKSWFIASIVYIAAIAMAPFVFQDSRGLDALSRVGGFALLIAWYYAIGKSQQSYVAAKFGKNYPRRGWAKPLLVALGAFVAFLVVVFLLALAVEGGAS